MELISVGTGLRRRVRDLAQKPACTSSVVQRQVVGLQTAVVEHDHLIGSAIEDDGIGESVTVALTTHGETLDDFIVATTSETTTFTDST